LNSQSPLVIPIFIAHEGCPHRCLFCNQRPITGTSEQAANPSTVAAVQAEIGRWLARSARNGRRVQVAFYGGSFTGLPLGRQRQLLCAVQPFIRSGEVNGIRLSTRPDYIDQETPGFLQGFGVETVELGVQSMDQKVLDRNLRGHSVRQVEVALALLKAAGLTAGAQLMVGLPGETTHSAVVGARRLAGLQPDFARLYPALVIRGSGLETLYRQGSYLPLSLPRAIILTARLTAILAERGIRVIRTGLQPSIELEANLVAGPFHPALGELVKARIYFNEVRRKLTPFRGRPCRLIIGARDRSLLSGQKRCSLRRLQGLNLLEQTTVMVTDSPSLRGVIRVEEGEGEVLNPSP
jgi:histone acetyltransferase (RNA polymerase elongator complex component)